MKRFVATINVPGYLPMADEPAVFDTAREAWQYLVDEVDRSWDEYPEDENGACVEAHSQLTLCDWAQPGSVVAPTPGYEGDHDLGLCYSVTESARIFALWHGGASYSTRSINDPHSLETFDSDSVEQALSDAATEAENRYKCSTFDNVFRFVENDEPTYVQTPCVSEESELHVWLEDPRDSNDPHPDYVIRYSAERDEFVPERV